MFKRAALTMGMLAMFAAPSIVSAQDYGYYRKNRDYYDNTWNSNDREWRERERHREHERRKWLERERRERERELRYYNRYNNGYYKNGYSTGYYDSSGYWHTYR